MTVARTLRPSGYSESAARRILELHPELVDRALIEKAQRKHELAEPRDIETAVRQIEDLNTRIRDFTEQFRTKTKIDHDRRMVLRLVGQRRQLLDYVMRKDERRHKEIVDKLKIRR